MTNAELAILSLILEKERHGYEIEQVIDERGMRDWTEVAFSSIYYILKKLENEELIDGRLQQRPGRGPARKVYQITDKGREQWHDATLNALSQPQRLHDPFQLALSNLPALPRDEALRALNQFLKNLRDEQQQLQFRQEVLVPGIPYQVSAMFDLTQTLISAEIAWLEDFIEKFQHN